VLATSRFPGADHSNAVLALGKHDRKQATSIGVTQQRGPRLIHTVARIGNYEAEGITEGRRGLIE
jgi:hypothetical protein